MMERITRRRVLAALSFAAVVTTAFGQVSQTWVQRYDSPAHDNDHGYVVKMDANGNILVAGPSYDPLTGYDFLTLKYSPLGVLLWERRYDGGAAGDDQAWSMAIDSANNVLVAGWSEGVGTGQDYLLLKYTPSGNLAWSRRFDGGAGGSADTCYGVGVDAARNVTITGYSNNPVSGYDCVTLQYDPNGNLRWQRTWAGPGTSFDGGYSMVIDSSGNVVITGDAATIRYNTMCLKYSQNGTLLWSDIHEDVGKDNFPYLCTTDSMGNVLVTGIIDGNNNSPYDMLTLKYAPDGNLLWRRTFNGPGNGFDYGWAITTDKVGNVFVGGPSDSPRGDYDGTILKYDPEGNLLWTRIFTHNLWVGDDTPGEFQTDGAGNLYMSGAIFNGRGVGDDYILQKYDPQGTLLWSRTYDGPTHGGDYGYTMARDTLGNIVMTGESSSATYSDFATVMFTEASVQVVPLAFNVTQGSHINGSLNSLFIDDQNCLGIFPDETSLVASVELTATTGLLNPSGLTFALDARVDRAGLAQSLALYNYDTNAWVNMDGRSAAVADQMVIVLANGNSGAFVGPSGQLAARVTWQPINDEDPSQDGWLHCIDLAKWTIAR